MVEKLFASIIARVIRKGVLKKALLRNDRYEWTDDDAKTLSAFVKGPTGAKLMAHLDYALASMMYNSAVESKDLSWHRLSLAKGFSLALAAIRMNLSEPYVTEEVSPAEADPFLKLQSQPTLYINLD